jgi:hypothetical protein
MSQGLLLRCRRLLFMQDVTTNLLPVLSRFGEFLIWKSFGYSIFYCHQDTGRAPLQQLLGNSVFIQNVQPNITLVQRGEFKGDRRSIFDSNDDPIQDLVDSINEVDSFG